MEQRDDLSKLKEPIFSRKKSLLTVGQYAARQGVSSGVVQEAAKLGVVQVRKHKDKTFIVDLPLDAYKIAKETDSPPFEDIAPPLADDSIHKVDSTLRQSLVQAGSGQVETEIDDRQEIKSIPRTARVHSLPKEEPLQQWQDWPIETLDLNLLAKEENKLFDNRDINNRQLGRFRIPILRNIIESITSISPSKAFFTLMTITFAVSISAYIWTSNDRKIQQQKLRGAYENISNLMTKYENVRQQARMYELDMNNWQSEAQRTEKAMTDYKTELESVKRSLYEARRDLQSTQRYNTDTLRKLNDQISKIRSQVPGPSSRPIE